MTSCDSETLILSEFEFSRQKLLKLFSVVTQNQDFWRENSIFPGKSGI